VEDVAREQHQVREFTGGYTSLHILLKLRIRRAERICTYRLLNRDLLFRHPAIRILAIKRAARDRRVDRQQRIKRRDSPVSTKRQLRTGIEQRTKRVSRLDPLLADSFLSPTTIVNRVIRL